MITGIEIPYFFALLYPSLNYIWLFPKLKPNVEKEIEHELKPIDGVEIYDYQLETEPATYINVGNIMVPIGGGTFKDRRFLLSKHISTDKKQEYFNYRPIDDKIDINMSFTKESHINTHSALAKTFKHYLIPTDKFAINLPLHINYYHYKDGIYLHKIGLVGSNKDKLVQAVLWQKRLPFTMTIPIIAGAGLVCCWTYYAIQSDYSYYPKYYPPFHYKRIKSYFTQLKSL